MLAPAISNALRRLAAPFGTDDGPEILLSMLASGCTCRNCEYVETSPELHDDECAFVAVVAALEDWELKRALRYGPDAGEWEREAWDMD
jgi:hypothetical protein